MYLCRRTVASLTINGDLTKPAWQQATRSPRFCDMATGAPAPFATQAAMLWDEQNLYAAFWVQEPFVEAHLTERDSLIFTENDVELFIDGGDCYYEVEINALGTLYEVFFIWRDAYERFRASGEFPLEQALSFGGDFDRTGAHFWRGTHPRGLRWAFRDWDLPGLRAAVQVQGRLNDPTHVDQGWTVELALPWAGLRHLANGRPLPPQAGDEWRMFLGRFQKMVLSGVEVQPHPAWVWTPHGVYDTHQPERWTPVRFVE
jgi:hypothetical protein